MSQKVLITKIVRRAYRADLTQSPNACPNRSLGEVSGVAKGHRYKDLILFDLSDLALVGIDYNVLAEGVETPCRFWAHYTLSDKLNGNPYKDVAGLEPFVAPAGESDHDTLTAILTELRAIRALLAVHVGAEPQQMERRYTNGSPVAANPAEEQAFDAFLEAEGGPPSSVAALRQWALDTPKHAP